MANYNFSVLVCPKTGDIQHAFLSEALRRNPKDRAEWESSRVLEAVTLVKNSCDSKKEFEFFSKKAGFIVYGWSSLEEMVYDLFMSKIPCGLIQYDTRNSACHQDDHIVDFMVVKGSDVLAIPAAMRVDYRGLRIVLDALRYPHDVPSWMSNDSDVKLFLK